MQTLKNKRIVVVVLILASSVTIMSTDIYAPSLAHLPDYFGTSPALVKLTMSLNMFAYALATLIHGPLSERFGRRPVLLWGMVGFTLFSLGCAVAHTVEQLIVARIFQGICAAVEGVLVLAIIRDLFDKKAFAHLATIMPDGSPQVTPVWCDLDGAHIRVNSARGRRKDLNMRRGKMIAQGAHASMKAVLDRVTERTETTMSLTLTEPMAAWLGGRFTKVCVYVKSEDELDQVVAKAREAGLTCALITDSGKTEFGGVPTKTCCAVGPNWIDDVDAVTGELPLL